VNTSLRKVLIPCVQSPEAMCGIFAVLGLTGDQIRNRQKVVGLARRIRHRGPDWECTWSDGKGNFLSHVRLAIVAPGEATDQPLFINKGADDQISWICNGEIYNHEALKESEGIYADGLCEQGTSDSEVVGHLYKKHGTDMVHMLDGMFAFVVCDKEKGTFFAARDHMGKIPMYIAYGKDGSVWFTSEMKSFVNEPMIERYEIFPPGMMYTGGKGGKGFERWYNPVWLDENKYMATTPADLKQLREVVVEAVLDRMMTDVPFGVLLSGGLDSSLVSSIAVKHLNQAKRTHLDGDGKLHSFTIGLEGAPDLAAARAVADQIGTIHHEFHFTVEEALDAIPDVVYHLESFEQVRASVPMFLLSRKIKAMGIKMVLSGEGADETLGGYLYFHKAPSPEEFHKECVRKTTRLHQWDVMRANKSTMAWGLEARTPFLGQKFLDTVMTMRPEDKMIDMNDKPDGVHPRMEKYILRKAFDTPEDPYLPESVLWRQKEQFSDGVGYDWVDGLKEYAEAEVSDEDFANRAARFPKNPPETKEYYYLRSLFEQYYPEPCALDTVPFGKSIACSTPEAVCWDPEWEKSTGDISGRAVGVHDSASGFNLEDSTNVKGSSKEAATACLSSGSTFKATIRTPARRTLRLPQQFRAAAAGGRAAPRARGLAAAAARTAPVSAFVALL
jgi:asparagine synthase (glutamine-hydrolysing)